MFTFVSNLLAKLPGPWRVGAEIGLALILIVGAFFLFGQIKGCQYDKDRAEYKKQSEDWQAERATILGRVAERDKQIEQLKAKEVAIIAADQAGKKLDDEIANKIGAVIQAANAEADATDRDTDCWIRGDRSCAKLAGLKPPIKIDCDAFKRKLCSQ